MFTLTGSDINFKKSSRKQWVVYFNAGTFKGENFIQTLEPFVLNLNPVDYEEYNTGTIWDVVYDTLTMAPYVIKRDQNPVGDCRKVNLGGFMIGNNCELRFLFPKSDCVLYNRIFTDEYDSDFDHSNDTVNICDDCEGAFSSDFSFDADVYICDLNN